MTVSIITNNNDREFITFYDLPAKIQSEYEDQFKDSFFIKYKKKYYVIDDFMRIENNDYLKGWDAYLSDSFFSGVLIKLSSDGDTFKIGRYYS